MEGMTMDDAQKMQECLTLMHAYLSDAETALEKFNRTRNEYNAIKERQTNSEEAIDDMIGSVYAGIIGAKKNVQVS